VQLPPTALLRRFPLPAFIFCGKPHPTPSPRAGHGLLADLNRRSTYHAAPYAALCTQPAKLESHQVNSLAQLALTPTSAPRRNSTRAQNSVPARTRCKCAPYARTTYMVLQLLTYAPIRSLPLVGQYSRPFPFTRDIFHSLSPSLHLHSNSLTSRSFTI
jgi:hypothetical protein